MPAQQGQHVTTAYTSDGNGPITAGQCVVLDASGAYYNVSTSSARTAAGRRSSGIAITSCAGTAQDRAFEVQVVGEIPSDITNLGAGTASVIRVSSAGILERAPSYSSSDDVVGFCDADGTAHVCFPLAGLGMALGAASAATPTNSVQASNADGSFRGASNVFVHPTAGVLQHGQPPYPTIGTERHAKDAFVSVRSRDNTRNLLVWTHTDYSSNVEETRLTDGFFYGGSGVYAATDVELRSKYASHMAAEGASGPDVSNVGCWNNPYNSDPSTIIPSLSAFFRPNLVMSPSLPFSVDPVRGARGILVLKYRDTAPSGPPAAGYTDLHCDPTTGHLTQTLPDGSSKDLWNGGSANDTLQTIDISSGAATANLANGKIIKLTGSYSGTATLTITPQPTTAALSNRFTVRNRATGTGLIVTNALSGKSESAMPGAFARLDGETTPDGVTGTVITGAGAISAVLV